MPRLESNRAALTDGHDNFEQCILECRSRRLAFVITLSPFPVSHASAAVNSIWRVGKQQVEPSERQPSERRKHL